MGSLTYPQRDVLRKLAKQPWTTAFELHAKYTTMRALEKRGLVQKRRKAGQTYLIFNNDYWEWAFTEAGERYYNENFSDI